MSVWEEPVSVWEEPAGEWEGSAGEWEELAGSGRSRRGRPPVALGLLTLSVPWAELSLEPHVLRGPQKSGFSLRKA